MRRTVDTPFLVIVLFLVAAGFFIFVSASLGLLAREEWRFSSSMLNQTVALGVGLALFFGCMRLKPTLWGRYSFHIFAASIVVTLLVFVPGLGIEHAGASRWLSLGAFSIQPAEFLKFGFILFLAAWCARERQRMASLQGGIVPYLLLLLVCGVILGLQPDLGTFIVIAVAGFAILTAGGASWKHLVALFLLGIVSLGALAFSVPYIKERVLTFMDSGRDPLGAGYQIQQSLIAIGSGEVFGRGFGQSVQKFNYLPEPVGDSIFAVFAEEWGFVGSVFLIGLFMAFLIRGYRIANHAPNTFSHLVIVGFVTSIVAQSFINMGSMLSLMPLTGDPLVFVSQGGTSLIVALAEAGIILSISRYVKTESV